VNNGSTDGTQEWLETQPLKMLIHYPKNTSPVKISNLMMARLFREYEHILGIPNDVRLPAELYRKLLGFSGEIVSASMSGENHEETVVIHDDVHMSVPLIRRSAYETMMVRYGYFFDEKFFLYGSDVELKERLRECGVRMQQTNAGCWHYGSASWRTAPEAMQKAIRDGA